MTEPHPDSAVRQLNFRDYLRILKRRRLAVVLTTIGVAVGSFTFSLGQQKVYRSSVQVLLSREDIAAVVTGTAQSPTLSEDPGRYAATQASVARSGAVAKLALDKAGVSNRTARVLLDESSVTPNANADLLSFVVDDADAVMAARLVNAYAAAFASYKLGLDSTALKNARTQLLQQIAALRTSEQQASAQYRNLVSSEQQLHTMQLLQSHDTVLSHPTLGVQIRPQPRRNGLLGLGFGLLLGIGLAFALDALDRRIRSVEEVEAGLRLPLLAQIPAPARHLRERFGVTMIDDPQGSHADAVRRLATSIGFANPDHPAQLLMITSAVQREGKSTTTANLGAALARAGQQVAVIDLDLRQPTLASLFGIHQLKGLTDVVVRRASLDDALVQIELPDPDVAKGKLGYDQTSPKGTLHVLPSGPLPASPGEFVGSEALATRVLGPLRERFDYVLVDSPPICVVADASILTARVDALIVVARIGLLQRPALRDLRRQIVASRAPTLGVVVTGVEGSTAYGYSTYFAEQAATAPSEENGAGGSTTGNRRSESRSRRARA